MYVYFGVLQNKKGKIFVRKCTYILVFCKIKRAKDMVLFAKLNLSNKKISSDPHGPLLYKIIYLIN